MSTFKFFRLFIYFFKHANRFLRSKEVSISKDNLTLILFEIFLLVILLNIISKYLYLFRECFISVLKQKVLI